MFTTETTYAPPIVYIIFHDNYDDTEVRAVYAAHGAAEANIVTRTKSGRRSTALDAHDTRCCRVEEHEVLSGEPT